MPNIMRVGSGEVKPQVYMYNEGNEYIDLTGGWVGGTEQGAGNISKAGNTLFVQLTSALNPSYRRYRTVNKVDVTDLKTIYIDWKQEGNTEGRAEFFLASTTTAYDVPDMAASFRTGGADPVFARRTNAFDVSALSGEYYIFVQTRFTTSGALTSAVTAYKIWGE